MAKKKRSKKRKNEKKNNNLIYSLIFLIIITTSLIFIFSADIDVEEESFIGKLRSFFRPLQFAPEFLFDCQSLSIENQVYVLTKDINVSGSDCFIITTNNITLNGGGHKIQNILNVPQTISGIIVLDVSNANIANLEITNFTIGINMASTINVSISNNFIHANKLNAISSNAGLNNLIFNNNLINNQGVEITSPAISLYHENITIISGNNFSNNNRSAIQILYGLNNTLENNVLINNTFPVLIFNSLNNRLINNFISYDGISLDGSLNNVLKNNQRCFC